MAGLAFVAGGITAAALSRFPLPWQRFRTLRWIAGTAVVVVLADIGHVAASIPPSEAGSTVAARLAAISLAMLMSMLGAYFTARR